MLRRVGSRGAARYLTIMVTVVGVVVLSGWVAQAEEPVAQEPAHASAPPVKASTASSAGNIWDAARTNGLTKEEFNRLMDAGYGATAVLKAGELVTRYGSDPWVILERFENGESWEAIIRSEQARILNSRPVPLKGALPDLSHFPLPAGLSEEDVAFLQARGHSLDEIKLAGNLAMDAGLDLRQVATQMEPGKSLIEGVIAADLARSPQERSAAHSKGLSPLTRRPEGLATGGISPFRLTPDEIKSLVQQGYTLAELQHLQQLTLERRVDIREVMRSRRPGETWEEAVQRAPVYIPAAPPVQTSQPRPSVEKPGVLQLQGNVGAPRQTDRDLLTAQEIAKAFKVSVEEVLALKQPGTSWAQVTEALRVRGGQ